MPVPAATLKTLKSLVQRHRSNDRVASWELGCLAGNVLGQGPPAARFVYVNSGTMAGQNGSCWQRRAKVPLNAIPPSLLVQAADRSGVFLQASIRGESKDGGPACATVPLLSGWTLAADT